MSSSFKSNDILIYLISFLLGYILSKLLSGSGFSIGGQSPLSEGSTCNEKDTCILGVQTPKTIYDCPHTKQKAWPFPAGQCFNSLQQRDPTASDYTFDTWQSELPLRERVNVVSGNEFTTRHVPDLWTCKGGDGICKEVGPDEWLDNRDNLNISETNCNDSCEADDCHPNPCQNEGTCRTKEDGGFECDCPEGFQGLTCELSDPCSPDICKPNGDCNLGVCTCHDGWYGEKCDTDIDPCDDVECGDHGDCDDGACVCDHGWRGPECDIRIDHRPSNTRHQTDHIGNDSKNTGDNKTGDNKTGCAQINNKNICNHAAKSLCVWSGKNASCKNRGGKQIKNAPLSLKQLPDYLKYVSTNIKKCRTNDKESKRVCMNTKLGGKFNTKPNSCKWNAKQQTCRADYSLTERMYLDA
jgi:hypothetical protein